MNIKGPSSVTLEQARAWAVSRGAHERFVAVADHYWQTAPRYGIPPEIPYAQAAHETDYGKFTGIVPSSFHNWCGLKTKQGGSNTSASAHQKFPDDATGVLAHVQHLARHAGAQAPADGDALVDPRWHLVTAFTDDVEGLGGAWAPSETYGDGIAALADNLREFAASIPQPSPAPSVTVALAAGHHNTSGGNHTEYIQVGRLTPAVADALRRRGFTVRVLTPDDGAGDFPGDLSDVANAVRETDSCFVEIHTEGNGAGDAGRGVFVIYPDWPAASDTDTDVRDRLGPAIANAISVATGLPIRGNGTMSERDTGVGGQGHRLGVFGATARYKADMERLIIEYGAHSSPADMAVWARPDFMAKAATATAEALADFYGLPLPNPIPEPTPVDDRILVEGNPFGAFGYRLGFKGRLQTIGASVSPTNIDAGILAWAGWALEDEWLGVDGCSYQRTERLILKWTPGVAEPWDITPMLRSDVVLPKRKEP